MTNHIYTFGALLVAGGLVFGAMTYTNKTINPLPVQKNNTAMLATVGTHTFFEKNSQEKRTVIDVRTKGEYDEGHIAGAVLIDISDPQFPQKIAELDTNAPYSVYCRSGNRSSHALSYMKANGFTDVIDLDGGVIAWQQNGETLCTNC